MSKQEAIEAMKDGKKITHRYFTPNEYMTMKGGSKIVFEDSIEMDTKEFWSIRSGNGWQDGFELFDEKVKA